MTDHPEEFLEITNIKTGRGWREKNTNHAWRELALELSKDVNCRLIWSHIECIVRRGDQWAILDECGNWEWLPQWYYVKVVS